MPFPRAFACAVVLLAVPLAVQAADSPERLLTVDSRPGVTVKVGLIHPEGATATVLLFTGGKGMLALSQSGEKVHTNDNGGNFLIRSRQMFAARGLAVGFLDAPSDRKQLNEDFRVSPDHGTDIAAVAARIKSETGGLPVWLVGTSMGTLSAAHGAVELGEAIAGLVLTSSVTRPAPFWDMKETHPHMAASLALDRVKVPSFILAHRQDGCYVTPPEGAERLKTALSAAPRIELLYVKGGSGDRSGPCEAFSAHGFIGMEAEAVDAIVAFIKGG